MVMGFIRSRISSGTRLTPLLFRYSTPSVFQKLMESTRVPSISKIANFLSMAHYFPGQSKKLLRRLSRILRRKDSRHHSHTVYAAA